MHRLESGAFRAALQPVGFETAIGQRHAAVLGQHDLLFELDASRPPSSPM